ncbi:hypothetical protein COOONC_20307, partial [Cooperia oncophora]
INPLIKIVEKAPRRSQPVSYCTREDKEITEKYRLIGCAVEKNFSTMLTAILCYLFDEENFLKNSRNFSTEAYHQRFCARRNEYNTLAEIERNMTSSTSDWHKIAVVRDPLEKFVSGFADKCLRRCEFGTHLHDFRILYFDTSNPSGFMENLLTVLRKSNVQPKSIDFIKLSVASKRTPHSTKDTVEHRETRRAILSNSYLLKLLVKMYFYDYVLFGYRIPDIQTEANK